MGIYIVFEYIFVDIKFIDLKKTKNCETQILQNVQHDFYSVRIIIDFDYYYTNK